MSGYRVSLEVFEGPLDLLLTLVRREKLDITTVALAKVTNDYLLYLASLEEIDVGALADFVEVGATLLLIKSRALLPQSSAPGDLEDGADGDAEELAERLRAFRRYRETADALGHRERAGLRAFVRTAPLPDVKPAVEPEGVSVVDLAAAFETALQHAAARFEQAPVEIVSAPRVRLSDRLVAIRRLLDRRGQVGFHEVLVEGRSDRQFIIVSFLAVLELLRRRTVVARQSELFGEIVLELQPEAALAGWTAEELTKGLDDG